MQVFGYYNLTTKTLSNAVDSDSSIALTNFVAGEALRFNVRFRETRDGISSEIEPNVRAMKAAVGVIDTKPKNGDFKIQVSLNGSTYNTSQAIVYTGDFAQLGADIKTGLEAVTSKIVELEERDGSLVAWFTDDLLTDLDFQIFENRLHPSTFILVRKYMRGDRFEYEFRLRRSPVAHVSTFERENPASPNIETLRDGSSVDDIDISEIQKLHVPAGFAGTFRLVKDNFRSEPLSRRSTFEEIQTTLQPLADPGGFFRVTNPADHDAYIHFEGDMAGTNFEDLGVEIFDAPPADYVVVLDTKTRAMFDALQEVDALDVVLEIHAEIEDPDDPEVFHWHTIYRRELRVNESVDADEFQTVPEHDWLNPPTFTSYNAFSPNQVSHGQIHYTTVIGDGVAYDYSQPHGLDTDNIEVIVTENQTPGVRLVNGTDYVWRRQNENEVFITFLTEQPPEVSQYLVTVLGLQLTSFFDPHTHVVADIDGLQELIDSIQNRLSLLEVSTGGSFSLDNAANSTQQTAQWIFPEIFELYPSRVQPTKPTTGRIVEIDLEEEDERGRKVIGRGRGLLAAIHDAEEATPLPVQIPSPFDFNAAQFFKAFRNDQTERVLLPGGAGNRSQWLKPGELATCDGRLWYPVERYGNFAGHDVSLNDDLTTWTYSNLEEQVPDGTKIVLETTGTLPSGFATGVEYEVSHSDTALKTFRLVSDENELLTAGDSGSGEHRVMIEEEITFYPRHFERTLFTIHVNENQLLPRRTLQLAFTMEAAVLASTTEAQWSVMLEVGEARQNNTTGAEGVNLSEIVWRKIPAFEQRIILTPSATTHRFGLRVERLTVGGIDTLQMWRQAYGSFAASGVVPPTQANFSIRARLGRFDVTDQETDHRGFVILSGLNLETEGGNQDVDPGTAVIN